MRTQAYVRTQEHVCIFYGSIVYRKRYYAVHDYNLQSIYIIKGIPQFGICSYPDWIRPNTSYVAHNDPASWDKLPALRAQKEGENLGPM